MKDLSAESMEFAHPSLQNRDAAAEFVFDVDADNVVERGVGAESECQRAVRVECARPSSHDVGDRGIGLAANEFYGLIAGDPTQCLDLFGHCGRESRHRQRPPRTERRQIDRRGVKKEVDGGARARMPVAHIFRHRQHRLLAGKRLAQDIGEKARRRFVGPAGSNTDGWEADADTVEETAARIVGEKQFRDRLLRPVAGQRGGEELIADRLRKRRAEDGDRRREDKSWPIWRLCCLPADRFEYVPRPVEIVAIALVEISLGLTGHDRRKMENDVRARRNASSYGGRIRDVEDPQRQTAADGRGLFWPRDVDERKCTNLAAGELAITRQSLRELAPDHAGGADDQYMHHSPRPRTRHYAAS